ncbi:MAG: hypothetical protein ACO35F_11490 [Ilumatobacteraceae bacterium]
MIALVLVTIGVIALTLAGYKLGSSLCEPDLAQRDSERNTALTVMALAVMFIMCAVLAAMAGPNSFNPLNAVTKQPVQ